MAYKLGDMTAKNEGRISLNPLKHIDPLGFILIIIAGFGWAKPVNINPDRLKNTHRDEILIALAGPFSNLVLGFLMIGITRFILDVPSLRFFLGGIDLAQLLFSWAIINFGLFIFNLIPIPPLDGSHIYTTFLAKKNPELLSQLYKYGTIALLAIILIQSNSKIQILPIGAMIKGLASFALSVFGLK